MPVFPINQSGLSLQMSKYRETLLSPWNFTWVFSWSPDQTSYSHNFNSIITATMLLPSSKVLKPGNAYPDPLSNCYTMYFMYSCYIYTYLNTVSSFNCYTSYIKQELLQWIAYKTSTVINGS